MDTNRQNLLNNLKNLYQINDEDIEDITGGVVSISLEEIRQALNKLKNLIPEKYLKEIINIMTGNEINSANNTLVQINYLINQIKSLNTNTPNVQQQAQNIIGQFKNHINTLIAILGKNKAILSDRLFEERFKNLSTYIEEKLENITKYEIEIEKRKNQIDKLTKEIQDISKEVSVEKYSSLFDEEAVRYRKTAFWYGISSVIVAGIVILFGYIFYSEALNFLSGKNSISASQLIAGNLFKIFILSIGIYVFLHLVKLFNVNMHLYVLNRHRHNALKTFRIFIDSVDDKIVKEQLTNTIAKYIFDIHSTGYIKSDSSKMSDSNIIFSLIEKGTEKLGKEK